MGNNYRMMNGPPKQAALNYPHENMEMMCEGRMMCARLAETVD
jgi:hypothetical protein